jgi:VIT1/CCC1 family predicted Fe2+/Mn2+ transporter
MGVIGATSGHNQIIIAGIAGLLAGSISMALGEWLSVQSSRELYQRQVEIEAEELESSPEEEMNELAILYQAKGMTEADAKKLAMQVLSNKETALDALVREELGIDKDTLGGSAWKAAFTSFFLFSFGAIIPVFPFFFLSGNIAIKVSLLASTLGLFGIGASISLFTGKNAFYSGFRQMLFGLSAAGITYMIGRLIGISIA